MTPRSRASDWLAERTRDILGVLDRYHRFELRNIHYLHALPRRQGALLVSTHPAATYPGFLVGLKVQEVTGRAVYGLCDRRFFDVPILGDVVKALGGVNADPAIAGELLRTGGIVGVSPGGMWEAVRPSSERYQLRWRARRGFARLALLAGVPVIPVVMPSADLIYTIYENPLTTPVYHALHLPLMIGRGVGPTVVPRPVKVTAHFGEPIYPEAWDVGDDAVESFRSRVVERTQGLLSDVVRAERLP